MEQDDGPVFVVGGLVGEQYTILDNPRGEAPRRQPGETARQLGRGGAGVVYLAEFKGQLRRALKFLAPHAPPAHVESFQRTFANEIRLLARLTHANLVKITDWDDTHSPPFFAMDYVAGQPIRELFAEFSAQEFLDVFAKILGAVDYLHGRGVLHTDLHAKNILCRRVGDDWEPVVLDLGVAKVVRPGLLQDPDEELQTTAEVEDLTIESPPLEERYTYFYSTPEICWRDWADRIGTRIGPEQLDEMFPSYDIYALHHLLDAAMNHEVLGATLRKDLSSQTYAALERVQQWLGLSPVRPHYEAISSVREDWDKLQPKYLAPMGIPEMSVAADFKHSIIGPSGRTVLTPGLHQVVNHPTVQRLRDIPQLELVSFIYPGASHSRLVHALTTYERCRRYVAHLLNDADFRLSVSPAQVRAVLLFSLLHDIGHYPLSHMFEDFHDRTRKQQPDFVPTDDDLFWPFFSPDEVTGAMEPFAAVYKAVWRDRVPTNVDVSLAGLIDEIFGPDTRAEMHSIGKVLDGYAKDAPPSAVALAGLLSTAADVDKLAYLQDDSTFTGVAYGAGIDEDGLLASLRMPASQELAMYVPTLAITDKGVSAAESLVMARTWMMKRVYWHHTNRAIMSMVKWVIARLRQDGRFSMEGYLDATLFRSVPEAVVWLVRALEAIDPDGVNPIAGLLPGNRQIYKRLLTVPFGPDTFSKDLHHGLVSLVEKERDPALLLLAESLGEHLAFHFGVTIRPGQVLIDVPLKDRENEHGARGGQVYVYPRGGDGRGFTLREFSPLIDTLPTEFGHHVKKCRVFVHPAVAERLGPEAPGEARSFLWQAASGPVGVPEQ